MSEQQFQMQPELTGIALAYTNKKLIAEKIFPQVQVNKQSFQYAEYKSVDGLKIPDTRIGAKGEANTYDTQSILKTATCENHSLKQLLPKTEIDDYANSGKDIRSITTMQLTNTLQTAREADLSKMLSDTSNYLKDNVCNVENNKKFGSENSEATELIEEYSSKVLGGANTMIISKTAFSKLRRDRSIINSVSINHKAEQSDTPGLVTLEAIKDLFGLDNIFIGESMIAKGKEQMFKACWANDLILLNIDPVATTDYGVTYGYNATYKDYTVGTYFDPDKGIEGCEVVKVYSSNIQLVTCKACGAILKGVI